MHVHVQSADGEAKLWLEPEIEIANSYNLSSKELRKIRTVIEERQQEIRDAWHGHFGS
jgi:hypothetical protein